MSYCPIIWLYRQEWHSFLRFQKICLCLDIGELLLWPKHGDKVAAFYGNDDILIESKYFCIKVN